MTLEDEQTNNTHDDSDSFVDAMAGLALVTLFVVTMVFWVSQQ
ncbi:MAG: hypothetical protein ACR2P1_00310 [Pseudomonadales bacterium]